MLEHADDVTAHMQPSPQSVAAFNAFASDNGLNVTAGGGHGEWMSFTTNVSHANALFAASFQKFQHSTAAPPITRTLSYSLPLALYGHVDTIHPMTTFGTPVARRNGLSTAGHGSFAKRQQADTFSPPPIVPASLELLYNMPQRTKDPAGVSILITGYEDQIPQAKDTAVSTFINRWLWYSWIACAGISQAIPAWLPVEHVCRHNLSERGSQHSVSRGRRVRNWMRGISQPLTTF
jgi:tripeptidyl-peptidase-1